MNADKIIENVEKMSTTGVSTEQVSENISEKMHEYAKKCAESFEFFTKLEKAYPDIAKKIIDSYSQEIDYVKTRPVEPKATVNVIAKIRIIDLLITCSNEDKLPNKLLVNGYVYCNESRSDRFFRYFSKENHQYFDPYALIVWLKNSRFKDHMTDTDFLCREIGVVEW